MNVKDAKQEAATLLRELIRLEAKHIHEALWMRPALDAEIDDAAQRYVVAQAHYTVMCTLDFVEFKEPVDE